MSDERNKKILAGVLLGTLAVVAAWRLMPSVGGSPPPADPGLTADTEGSRPLVRQRGGRGRGRNATPPEQLAVVDLAVETLSPELRDYEIGRNLWRYYQPPGAPPPVRTPPPTRVTEFRPPPPPVFTPPPPPAKQLPQVDFRYLGSFGPSRRKIAVLSDDKEIYNVVEGGVVKKEFVISEIGFESVTLEYKNHPDEESLRLPIGG